MKTVAIVQARMRSTRLEGKVLAEAAGKPLLVHMIERLKRCETLDDIVVALPEGDANQPIVDAIPCLEHLWWIRGSEDDVLGRVLQAAQQFGADLIVETTADCPLLDPAIVDGAVRLYGSGQPTLALVSSSRPSLRPANLSHAYPPGMDTRVFSTRTLEQVDRLTNDPVDREHVSLYIWEHQDRFWCHDLLAPEGLRDDVRLTVDTPEDLELVRKIIEHFSPANDFGLAEILRVLDEHPEWRAINENVRQKEVR